MPHASAIVSAQLPIHNRKSDERVERVCAPEDTVAKLFWEIVQNNEFGTHHTVGFGMCIAENLRTGGELHAEATEDGIDDLVDQFRFVRLDRFFAEAGKTAGRECLPGAAW